MTQESALPLAAVKYDLLSPSFFADPHAVFRRMRAEDPVYYHPLLRFWVLTRHDDIQTISRDPRFSAERTAQFTAGTVSEALRPKHEEYLRFLSHWMLFRDPPRHTVLRALVMKAFNPQVIEEMRPSIERLVAEMLDRVLPTGEMDVARDLAFPLPAMVIASMLGVPRDRMDYFKAATEDVFAILGAGVVNDDAVARGHRGVVGLRHLFEDLIHDRKKKPTEDLLSKLLAVEEQGTVLDEEELISTCAMLLIAGHETTSSFIGNAVLALLRNPGELARLKANPGLVEDAVEELLRYDPPVYLLSRQASTDVEISGVTIRAGDIVAGMIHAGNRDPAVYKDPDRLDLQRHGAKGLAFGHGIHYCIGAALGRIEAQIALREIVGRLEGLSLASDVEAWIPSIAIRGLASLPVKFEPTGRKSADSSAWDGPMSSRAPLSVPAPVSVHSPPSIPPPQGL